MLWPWFAAARHADRPAGPAGNTTKLRHHTQRVSLAGELQQQVRRHHGRQSPVPTFEGPDELLDGAVVLPGGDVVVAVAWNFGILARYGNFSKTPARPRFLLDTIRGFDRSPVGNRRRRRAIVAVVLALYLF